MNLHAALQEKGFTAAQSEVLAAAFRTERELAPGDFFLQEGEVCRELALIEYGMCRFFYHTDAGEATRWVCLSGDFMTSLASFIRQEPSVENLQALKPTKLHLVGRSDWDRLFAGHEFVRTFWHSTIEANYLGMEDRVFRLIAQSAEQRYEWMNTRFPRFQREVPDKYLASMLGVTPRHLTRIRAQRK